MPRLTQEPPNALQQLIKGLYAAFLTHWFQVWPRNRIMILRTEDYKAAPDAHVEAAAKFLGMINQ